MYYSHKKIDISLVSSQIDEEIRNKEINVINLKYLQGYKVIHEIGILLKKKYITISEDYLKTLRDRKGFYLGEKIEFRFDNDVCFCKNKHVNDHYIMFLENYILISKNGNPTRCETHRVNYPTLSWYEIGLIIKNDLNILLCTESNEFMIWNGYIWKKFDDESVLLSTIMEPENFKVFRFYHDKKKIETDLLKGSNFKSTTDTIKSQKVITNTNKYSFSFANGVFDFKQNKFITGREAKNYVNINDTGYDYKD